VAFTTPYQAVLLTNGSVYFGHLEGYGGRNPVNYSEIVGAGVAAGISTYSYHPSGDRGVGTVANVWGTQMGFDAFTYMIKGFWPDLRRKHEKQSAQTQQ
jgi:hypothetical protein